MLVPLDDLSRQPSVRGHVKTLLLSPRPDLATALAAGRGTDLGPAPPAVHPPRAINKRRQPAPQVGRVLGAQIKLIRRAFQRELNRLVGRAAGQVVLQLYLKPLHLLPPRAKGRGKPLAPGQFRSYPGRHRSIAGLGFNIWPGGCQGKERVDIIASTTPGEAKRDDQQDSRVPWLLQPGR
jgi:hypothetical protein